MSTRDEWPPRDGSSAATSADEERAITLVLVDDHILFRTGLRELLVEQGFAVVGEAANGEEAVATVTATTPTVAVIDLHMPGMDGIEATRQLREAAPATSVLILTVSPNDSDVSEAVMAGARGYVLKDAPVDEIVGAIRAVSAGESLLSSRIAAGILERVRSGEQLSSTDRRGELLTERECTVLRLLADGKENGEIATELVISIQTVKNHVSNILAKLEVNNRVQAAVHAVRHGLL